MDKFQIMVKKPDFLKEQPVFVILILLDANSYIMGEKSLNLHKVYTKSYTCRKKKYTQW